MGIRIMPNQTASKNANKIELTHNNMFEIKSSIPNNVKTYSFNARLGLYLTVVLSFILLFITFYLLGYAWAYGILNGTATQAEITKFKDVWFYNNFWSGHAMSMYLMMIMSLLTVGMCLVSLLSFGKALIVTGMFSFVSLAIIPAIVLQQALYLILVIPSLFMFFGLYKFHTLSNRDFGVIRYSERIKTILQIKRPDLRCNSIIFEINSKARYSAIINPLTGKGIFLNESINSGKDIVVEFDLGKEFIKVGEIKNLLINELKEDEDFFKRNPNINLAYALENGDYIMNRINVPAK